MTFPLEALNAADQPLRIDDVSVMISGQPIADKELIRVRLEEKFSLVTHCWYAGSQFGEKAKVSVDREGIELKSKSLIIQKAGEFEITIDDLSLEYAKDPHVLNISLFRGDLFAEITGWHLVDSRKLNVLVVKIQLETKFDPNAVVTDENFEMKYTVMNTGNDVARRVSVRIVEFGDFIMRGEVEKKIGDIPPEGSGFAKFDLTAPSVWWTKTSKLKFEISYFDIRNEQHSVTLDESLTVTATASSGLEKMLKIVQEYAWGVIVFTIAIGVFIWIILRMRKIKAGGVILTRICNAR